MPAFQGRPLFSARGADRSNRYMWISGPVTTVHYEHICHDLAAVAMVGLATRRWLSDKSRSAAVVLGNHQISVGQRVRAALPADIDSMAGTAGLLNLRIWADQGMQARATGPRHMAVRGSRLRYACRPMGNDPPESHHNQGHPDLHARSTVHTRRSEVASGGFTEPPTL